MGANERASAARPGAGGAGTARVMHARGDRRRQPAGEGRGAMRAGAGSRSREQEQVPPGGRSAPAAPLPPAPAPLPPGAPQQRAVNPLCSRGCVLPQSRALRSLGGTDHIDLIAGFALGRPFRSAFFFFFLFSLFFFFFLRTGRRESGNVRRQLVLCLRVGRLRGKPACWEPGDDRLLLS